MPNSNFISLQLQILLHRLVDEALQDRVVLLVNRPDLSHQLIALRLVHLQELGRHRLQDQGHLVLQKLDAAVIVVDAVELDEEVFQEPQGFWLIEEHDKPPQGGDLLHEEVGVGIEEPLLQPPELSIEVAEVSGEKMPELRLGAHYPLEEGDEVPLGLPFEDSDRLVEGVYLGIVGEAVEEGGDVLAVAVGVEVGAGAAKRHPFRIDLDVVAGGPVDLRPDDAVDDDGVVDPVLLVVPPAPLQDLLREEAFELLSHQ